METDMKKVELYNDLLAKLVRKPKAELLAEFGGQECREYALADGTLATVRLAPDPNGGFPSLSIELSTETPSPEAAPTPALPAPEPGPATEPPADPDRKPKVSYPDAIDCLVAGYTPEMSWRVLKMLLLVGQLTPDKIDRVISYIGKIM